MSVTSSNPVATATAASGIILAIVGLIGSGLSTFTGTTISANTSAELMAVLTPILHYVMTKVGAEKPDTAIAGTAVVPAVAKPGIFSGAPPFTPPAT